MLLKRLYASQKRPSTKGQAMGLAIFSQCLSYFPWAQWMMMVQLVAEIQFRVRTSTFAVCRLTTIRLTGCPHPLGLGPKHPVGSTGGDRVNDRKTAVGSQCAAPLVGSRRSAVGWVGVEKKPALQENNTQTQPVWDCQFGLPPNSGQPPLA